MARRETTDPAGAGTPAAPSLPDPATLGYEQARDELVSIVARLESGAGTLEESLALWERGEALAARCQEWLDGARARLTSARSGAAPDAAPQAPGAAADIDEQEER
ncbi:exodeoxyribonuclease VII small subunit [Cellulomonas dongxiuzhuiae]|uniref:Exodeoxyribonuclease 7 small subunit n=1 Tax=Cellulomonas dongxiuzhuiae TaxID=2819979 RepID=A0ABX8GMP8_9CELL|nr:exodeoxyribonuclease VII small subunit [Cellulomonas dongxiuzhuiae]MBO3096547.1 exodeoxyribonuclease VII small subunit [Cellulomonas dongxiuzhuiae]QWC16936.1 exodeoxyribonuclease VII small subunit [Cellulomonas dongxiuzhuiae]